MRTVLISVLTAATLALAACGGEETAEDFAAEQPTPAGAPFLSLEEAEGAIEASGSDLTRDSVALEVDDVDPAPVEQAAVTTQGGGAQFNLLIFASAEAAAEAFPDGEADTPSGTSARAVNVVAEFATDPEAQPGFQPVVAALQALEEACAAPSQENAGIARFCSPEGAAGIETG